MKLNYFTPENAGRASYCGDPSISFANSGCITLNSKLIEVMQVGEDDRVVIANDPEHEKDWFIIKRMDGFKTRTSDKGGHRLIQCAMIAKKVQDVFNQGKKNAIRFSVAPQPTTIDGVDHWLIIASKMVNTTRR